MPKTQTSAHEQKLLNQMRILRILVENDEALKNGVRWTDLKASGLSKRALSIRLKELVETGVVKRFVDVSQYPPEPRYRLVNESELKHVSKDDIEFAKQIQQECKFLRGLESIAHSQREEKARRLVKDDPLSAVRECFREFYKDFAWTLFRASRAPSPLARGYLIDGHVESYRRMLEGLASVNTPKWREIVKEAWNLSQESMDKWKQSAKENYVSRFPEELKPIAEAFFKFYLYERKEVDQDMITTCRELVMKQLGRKRFETLLGEKISDELLERFIEENHRLSKLIRGTESKLQRAKFEDFL